MDKRDSKGRFIKGSIGNPKGRPKRGRSLAELIRNNVNIEDLINKLADTAKDGDLTAIRLVFEHGYGKPVSVDIESRLAELEDRLAEKEAELHAKR